MCQLCACASRLTNVPAVCTLLVHSAEGTVCPLLPYRGKVQTTCAARLGEVPRILISITKANAARLCVAGECTDLCPQPAVRQFAGQNQRAQPKTVDMATNVWPSSPLLLLVA